MQEVVGVRSLELTFEGSMFEYKNVTKHAPSRESTSRVPLLRANLGRLSKAQIYVALMSEPSKALCEKQNSTNHEFESERRKAQCARTNICYQA